MNSRAVILAFAAILPITLAVPHASAAPWPDRVDTTPWTVFENRGSETAQLDLVQTNDPASACERLTGTLTNTGKVGTPVDGFYCPDTGRFVLSRRDSKGVYQAWFGQTVTGGLCTVYVAGSVARLKGKTSNLGEIPFSMHQNCD